MGIEPTLSAWEAEVLPLNYTRGVRVLYTFDVGRSSLEASYAGNVGGALG